MKTSLAVDENLLEEAVRLGGDGTEREVVEEALRQYVARKRRLAALDAFGTIDFDPAYDPKQARRAR